jgi:pyrroloquinoline-quinone synthase
MSSRVVDSSDGRWDRETFVDRLNDVGRARYHDSHPFHRKMNDGQLSPEQLRGWVANRFHYQRHLPMKDALILSSCPLPEVRRVWRRRLVDQDGDDEGRGGIEAWLTLADAVGLTREETIDGRHVVPGVRFAVEAYMTLVRSTPWPVAVASSLTELFAPGLMAKRAAAFRKHYGWIPVSGLVYFESRKSQAQRDAEVAKELTLIYCDTPALQQAAIAALQTKCDILWAMLDAVTQAY